MKTSKWDNDMEFEETSIAKVEEDETSYIITREEGWCFSVDKKHGIEPKRGMKARFYGRSIGFPVRGLMLDGKMVFYKTPTEQEEEHKKWIEKTREEYLGEYKKLMIKIKEEETFETIDISGMGGGYERCCQLMLRAGREYLKNERNFAWDYKQYENVYGICSSKSEEAKKLDTVLLDAAGGDCSGAMHQAVINHLAFIHKNGYEKWLEKGSDRRYRYPKELPKPSF